MVDAAAGAGGPRLSAGSAARREPPLCYFSLAYGFSWLVWAPLWLRAVCRCFGLSLLTGVFLLTWLYNESRGSLLVAALFDAEVDVAFTAEASPPVVINTADALITLWGIAVVLIAGPRLLASLTSHKEHAS